MKRSILFTLVLLISTFSAAISQAENQAFDVDYLISLARSLSLPAQIKDFDSEVPFFMPVRNGIADVAEFQPNQADRYLCQKVTALPVHPSLPVDLKEHTVKVCGLPMLHPNYVYSRAENFLGVNRFTLSPLGNDMTGFVTFENKIVGVEHRQYSIRSGYTESTIDLVLPNGAVAHQETTDIESQSKAGTRSTNSVSSLVVRGANNSFIYLLSSGVSESGETTVARVTIPTIQQDEVLVIQDTLNQGVATCEVKVLHGTREVLFEKTLSHACAFATKN